MELLNKLRRAFGGFALTAASTLLLCACGSSSNQPDPPPEEPAPAPTTGPLQTKGTQWVAADGTPIELRGTNIGNWLLQEFWMMAQSTDAVNDQCTLEGILDERFGFDERERIMTLFRDNWITERDWDLMADFGLNLIRLPFIYNLIEDEHEPFTLREDAWHYLDLAIEEAEARNMYVILDLHGAVGSQGWEHHSGCAGLNEYWDNPEYQARTVWLWQQIAQRYRDNNTVAAYGLLNEPWGTDAETLADVMETLYHSVREVDKAHVIILPGHDSGIDAYGNPADRGMTNVAFDMHFYPGIFGWGEIGYEVHRDWLTCGSSNDSGVCEWDQRLTERDTAFLVGEFQPWAGLGLEQGAQIARATYDTYARLGWASTSWAYKVITNNGGQGQGTWGKVTNRADISVLVKANTWVCPGWDNTFADACDTALETFSIPGDAAQTFYLVVKVGATQEGELDVSFDSLRLTRADSDEQLLTNGDFGSGANWHTWSVTGSQTLDFDYADEVPEGGDAPVLRITGPADTNGGIYQAMILEPNTDYRFSGTFRDNGSSESWAEVYLVSAEPVEGIDVTGEQVPTLDFHNDSLETIEKFFRSLSTMEYDLHEPLMQWLTAEQGPNLFNLP